MENTDDQDEDVATGDPDIEEDELFEEAKRIVIEEGITDPLLLQKRLRIGYSCVVYILDRLKEDGVVNPRPVQELVKIRTDDSVENIYNDAVKLARKNKNISTTIIQKAFAVSYSKATLLIDLMEKNGLVGKSDETVENGRIYTKNTQKAIRFATKAHAGQTRKGKMDVPYITHPLGVALILSQANADEAVIIAGILHDTVEDSDGKITLDDIKKLFGETVAVLVEYVTEKDKKLSWEERKKEALAHIYEMPHDAVLLKSADILYNLSDLLTDLEDYGNEIWARFNAPREKQISYYNKLVEALKVWPENPLLSEIQAGVEVLNKRLNKEQKENPELLERAIVLLRTQRISVSFLQNNLQITFSRAKEILDMMVEKGIVAGDNEIEEMKRYFQEEKFSECLEAANKILETRSDFDAICYKGTCLEKNKQYDEAIEILTICIETYEGLFYLWVTRGDCYYAKENWESAFNDYNKAVELDPDNGAAMDKRSRCLFRMGDPNASVNK